MAIKVRGEWLCGYCGTKYPDQAKADVCRENHELIYVAFTKKDLNMLMHFIRTKDESFLTESLMKTLDRYLRGQ